eukprot:3572993-Amphidinium_carterae.1
MSGAGVRGVPNDVAQVFNRYEGWQLAGMVLWPLQVLRLCRNAAALLPSHIGKRRKPISQYL